MKVHEYKTKYVDEEQAVNIKEVVLNTVQAFVLAYALLLIGMALPAILPSESLIIKVCSTLLLVAAVIISVYSLQDYAYNYTSKGY